MQPSIRTTRANPHDHPLAQVLARHVSGEVRFDNASRVLYSTDASNYQVYPLGVVCPKNADDIAATVRLCAEAGVSVIPRGGGSGLCGQAIGPGVVMDTSKFMDALLDVDTATRTCRAQPGLALGMLNRKLAQHKLQFGPDPASAERATIGGNIGTNAAGAHSIQYGMTADHVLSVRCVLADGSSVEFGPTTNAQSSIFHLQSSISNLVSAHAPAIYRDFPKVWRRASGYNVDYMAEMLAFDPASPAACLTDANARRQGTNLSHHIEQISRFNLAPLIVGSEGTLAMVTEATLKLVPKPSKTALLIASFDSMDEAMKAVPVLLSTQPAAIELLDELLLTLGRDIPDIARRMTWLSGNPLAVLVIEFAGESEAEVRDGVARAQALAAREHLPCALVPLLDAASQADLWYVRKVGQNIYYSMRSERKPISVVEDIAVPVGRLAEFVRELTAIFAANGTTGGFYAHASAGVLHVRPMVNLKTKDGVQQMDAIARQAFDLCVSMGGAMSGEHGDGYQRTVWNQPMFGGEVYGLFCEIKDMFDPQHVLNPNKKVRAKDPLESLRLGENYKPAPVRSTFSFQRDGSFAAMVEQCNGNGDCRRVAGGVMCPSYRATREEMHSTRGRANMLRALMAKPLAVSREPLALSHEPLAVSHEPLAISREPSAISREPSAISREPLAIGREPSAISRERLATTSHQPPATNNQQPTTNNQQPATSHQPPATSHQPPTTDEVRAALDLCLSCKACETECATQVDMAKLKSDFMQRYHDEHGTPMRAWFLGRIGMLSALAAPFAPLANAVAQTGLFKRLLRIAPQRTLPAFTAHTFDRWWKQHQSSISYLQSSTSQQPTTNNQQTPVVLFVDTFARYNHPHIAIAAVRVLEHLGFDVIVPPWKCCGRPLISQGQPRAALDLARYNIAQLAPYAKSVVPILGLEPSCISALKDDYLDLVPGQDAKLVAERVMAIEDFVSEKLSVESSESRVQSSKFQVPSSHTDHSSISNLHHPLSTIRYPLLLHGHCHQKAVYGTGGTKAALLRAGFAVREIDSTCCGMAGAFGYEAEHYDISQQIGELSVLPAIRNASAETLIVAPGTSCREQIEHFAGRKALHPIEALAKALGFTI